ncbi:MAG: GatB/YqeY domain-containing protein [Rhodothermales bacterium]
MAEVSLKSIELDLRNAMIAHEEIRVRTLRSIKAAIQSREIEQGRGTITAADIQAVLQKQAKQRRDSMAQFESAGRTDLFSREEEELAVIETYLPEQLGQSDLEAIVRDAISSTGAESVKDMGRVMGVVMPKVKGRADGNLVREAVTRLLA